MGARQRHRAWSWTSSETANVFLSDDARTVPGPRSTPGSVTTLDRRLASDDSPGEDLRRCDRGCVHRAAAWSSRWSKTSVSSHWFRSEAAEGARAGHPAGAPRSCARFRSSSGASRMRTGVRQRPLGRPVVRAIIRSISTPIEAEAPTCSTDCVADGSRSPLSTCPAAPAAGPHRNSGRRHRAAQRGRRRHTSPSSRRSGAVSLAGDAPEGSGSAGDGNARRSRPHHAAVLESAPVAASDSRIDVPLIVGLRVDAVLTRLDPNGLSVS